MKLPGEMRWLFWDVDFDAIDPDEHANYVLPRVLERGRLADVRWAIRNYGTERIHRFLRDVGHPEISGRTLCFWRAFFRARDETWQTSSRFPAANSTPWIS